MNKITTKEQAIGLLLNVYDALDQLNVRGHDNCIIVAACGNDIQAVRRFLLDGTEETERPILEGMKGEKQ